MNDNKRICSNCGQPLEADDVFCGECGHRVSLENNEASPLKATERTQQACAPQHMPPPHPASLPQASNKKPRLSFINRWLIATIPIGLLVAVVFICFIFESSNTEITAQISGQDNPVINQIKITNLESFYEQNTSARKILVIIGNVINQSTSPIRFIQLQATLYGSDNTFLTRLSAYAGNVVDRQQLKIMPIHSIKLMMHKPYGHNPGEQLAAGATLPFMIVFTDLPNVERSRYEVSVISASAE